VQYLPWVAVGIAFLIFVGVAGLVIVAVGVKLLAGGPKLPRVVPTAAPRAQSAGDMLDLVEAHLAAEDRRRRLQRLQEHLMAFNPQAAEPPKA
jgi:hypothetical protein